MNLTFENFQYARPQFDLFSASFRKASAQFEAASSAEEQARALALVNELRIEFTSMYNVCHIRHTMDTRDAFYEKENEYFDQQMPAYEGLVNEFYKLLINSPFRDELEKKWGRQLFTIAELSLKTFDESVIGLLQEENKLSSDYTKLKAKAKIGFRGEEHNLSSIVKYEMDMDRAVRKEATEAKWAFFSGNAAEIEGIFDQLVRVRHRIARELGYENFVELGYARMLRSDYGPEKVANFRLQVQDYIVPIATRLYERQRRRLGLEQLKYYDEELRFHSGNPQPKGEPDWIVGQARRMYSELSEETREFFDFMRQAQLMDLQTRPGKATGGYCTYIGKYQTPFIFSNFNGTSGDIDVLTHEAGHAFQVFSSRDIGISEYNWPTFEACEIHSMSMEFFTWPWMQLFFKEDADKYKFSHLSNALYFLPYGVAVDEFQHFVYEHPEASPAERNQAWRDIERKYLPHRDYDGHPFLENGGYWQKQSHIFVMPFYYIDYTLAQICAFQFWKKDQEGHQQAWSDYVRLCQAGGSRSFLELVQLANLRSPFEDGCVASVVDIITEWLDGVDDAAF
ncbi:MAG: M3 family oligoendopeptidase [Lewinellaceae bacterium]|nr:M3 family oligoendopeptidase [Phaeodactylibacter sp.]MCB9347094.1 M3 family oligoendopeptidase [Lewinellaceae bacterium]